MPLWNAGIAQEFKNHRIQETKKTAIQRRTKYSTSTDYLDLYGVYVAHSILDASNG